MKSRNKSRGAIPIGLIIFLVVVGIFIAIVFVAFILTSGSGSTSSGGGGQTSGQVPGTNTCFSQCLGAVELECGTNNYMGLCLGAWGCTAELGTHTCLR